MRSEERTVRSEESTVRSEESTVRDEESTVRDEESTVTDLFKRSLAISKRLPDGHGHRPYYRLASLLSPIPIECLPIHPMFSHTLKSSLLD